jgi:hypothetical protein
MARGTSISPNMYQKFQKNEENALEESPAQVYTLYCYPSTKILIPFLFDKVDQ